MEIGQIWEHIAGMGRWLEWSVWMFFAFAVISIGVSIWQMLVPVLRSMGWL
jgi:hypothetical protein